MVRDPALRGQLGPHQRRATYGSRTRRGPASVPPPPRSARAGTGWSSAATRAGALRDLARQDPDYLRWLSRHASGLRYRTEIYQILGRQGSPPPDLAAPRVGFAAQ